jgi:hypothetical protein
MSLVDSWRSSRKQVCGARRKVDGIEGWSTPHLERGNAANNLQPEHLLCIDPAPFSSDRLNSGTVVVVQRLRGLGPWIPREGRM